LSVRKLDRSALQGEVLQIFKAAIKSPLTRDVYERRLLNFLGDLRMTPECFLSLAKNNPSSAEKKIITFAFSLIRRYEKGEIAAGTVHNCVKCVRLLLEMNDIFLNWKKISRILPKVRRYALDRIPTIEEIHEIVEAADIREKALTLVFVSSGIREGAIEQLKVGDYTSIKVEGEKTVAGRLVVYSGDPEKYTTFVSPEACHALDKYLDFRREHGEEITKSSPLFRDKFDPIKGLYGHGKINSKQLIIPMTSHAIRQYYNRLLFTIGIRNERKRRHDFSVHGFRKFFKTKTEIGGMKPINVETLMGHSTGISDSYYRPTENDLLDDYLKIVDHLTIRTESTFKAEVEKVKERGSMNEDAISTLSDQVMKLMVELQELKKQQR
jgi:integrase